MPLLPALVLATTTTLAGEIFGDVRIGEKYVAKAPIQMACGADTVRAVTDDAGSFRLASKGSGKCVVTLTYEGKAASVDVVVFEKPARYRLILERKDGGYVLKRV
ncbi:MAG: hypothetical protein IT361_06205 [Gemmatimonadaceae bacterium]|nr:hypothetical protein [Gemmatimonadaceae bacterium]